MSSLVFVRHGQASFFARDYDCLSTMGKEQACRLGRYWKESGAILDEVIAGPRVRHRTTRELVLEAMQENARPAPLVREEPGFDEHQLEVLLREPKKSPPPEPVKAAPEAADDELVGFQLSRKNELRIFRDLLEEATGLWLAGKPEAAGIEPWPVFKERVRSALRQILEQSGRGRNVAVMTSAGVIGVVLQQALECSDAQAMALSRRLRNGSLTEFVFTRGRFTLDGFNGVPHLPDRRLWTYL